MRIGIVGAGPAGLTAAVAAAQLGLAAEVLERTAQFRPAGAGLGLHRNGLRVLEALGVLQELRPKVCFCSQFVLHLVGDGEFRMDLGKVPGPWNQFAVVLRHDLQQALYQAAQQSAPLRFGYRVCEAQRQGQKVVLHFQDHPPEEFDLVVACDGVRSAVRDSLKMPCHQRAVKDAFLRGVAPCDLGLEEVHEFWTPEGRLLGLCPLPEGKTYFYCTAPENWPQLDSSQRKQWLQTCRPCGPQVMDVLEAVEDWNGVHFDCRLCEVWAKRWYQDRVFLAGDAAHAMMPHYGQGANSAMVDAMVLMQLLAQANQGRLSLTQAARKYHRLRQRFVRRIQQAARQAAVLSSLRSSWGRWMRHSLLRLSSALPWLQRQSLYLATGYHPAEEPFLELACQ